MATKGFKKRARRIVLGEYTQYLIECLRTKQDALEYEEWLKRVFVKDRT